ncbi:MAG: hypothetical protein LUD74_07240, partial [Tannerellaceae bacterium]|nr:hypothetical protein [Tannerellaceae bacterium]
RYGEDYPQKSRELVIKRMDKWGLNTIANWSSMEVINMNQKAFMIPLHGLGMQWDLMGLTDIYDPQMTSQIDQAIKEFVTPYKDNPWLIGYFVGNEPAWLEQEARLCGMILDGPDRPIKTALQKYLANGDTPEKRKEFIYTTFETFLQTVKKSMQKYDPNHLNLGIRFGDIDELDEDLLMICKRAFDVFSFNCYDLYPSHKMMDRFIEIADMPLVIGEYHFGAPDRGMAQSLWQVDNQQERGVAYRYYTENAYSHPGLIGTGYFQWGDQDLTGRGHDGENYNCGIVDVTDRPYKYMVEAMSETAKRLYSIHTGELEPLKQGAKRPRGHEQIPDLWNE